LNEVITGDFQDAEGNTLLHHACICGTFEVIKLLLDKGHKTDVRNLDGKSPLDLLKNSECGELVRNYIADIAFKQSTFIPGSMTLNKPKL